MKKFYAVLIVFAALFLSFDISFAREEINPGPPLIITSGTYSDANESVNGGIFYNEGELIINNLNGDIKFINNEVDTASCSGGAIYTVSGSTTTIGKGVEFSSNTAGHGGAIRNKGKMTIDSDSNFSFNDVRGEGGAIFNDGELTISTGANFISNISNSFWYGGGAILNSALSGRVGKLTIGSDSKFSLNAAVDGAGGAIYNELGLITIGDRAEFSTNTAVGVGGAIYNNGVMTIGAEANFSYNSAYNDMNYTSGGAIYNTGKLTIGTGAQFIENLAVCGGAIFNAGDLTIEDGALFSNNITLWWLGGSEGAIFNDGGTLNLTAETQNIEFTGNGNAIYDNNGTINLYTKGADIIFNDGIWSLDQNSTLNINDTTDPIKGKVILNTHMGGYNGQINLYSGTVELGEDGTWFSGNTYVDNAEINLTDGSIYTLNMPKLMVDTELRLSVEADLEDKDNYEVMDSINANSFLGTGKIKVNAIKVLKDGNKKVTDLYFAGGVGLIEQVESVNVAYSPIYKYNVKYFTDYTDGPDGFMRFKRTGANPLSQAASISNFGIYTAQSEIVKQVFLNAAGGTLEKRASLKNNLYVSADSNRVFSEGSLKRGVWVSPYIVKDTIEFGKYVKDVENSINGILAGVDLVVDKDNGISLYCGYNGGSQKYDNVEMSQSGYILGASGIILKGKFYFGAAANVIINNNEAKSSLGTSEMENLGYTAGFKGGYDITAGNNWTIEPNMIVMYSQVTASEYINAEGHKIKDKGIKGLLVKPGVKAKVDLKDGWQPYGLMDITINTGESATKVSGIDTESLKLAPYYEFGLGVNKDFANTPWSAYAQLTGKSGSRAGAGVNLGVKYAF